MKKISILLIALACSTALMSQTEYEPSDSYPFGQPNPAAPPEIADYQPMIGICDCLSSSKKQDGTWADPVKMTWEFKYIMNGMAVQDQTLKDDGAHSGSIRQFIADSSAWFVHYYASAKPSAQLGTWKGGKKGSDIVLYKNQQAPNGMEGSFRLTFFDISDKGYNWVGEWVSLDETIVFPTWKIECLRPRE